MIHRIIQGGLDGARIVGHAVADSSEIFHIVNQTSVRLHRIGRARPIAIRTSDAGAQQDGTSNVKYPFHPFYIINFNSDSFYLFAQTC